MSALFLKILNLSINASWLILAVIAARLLLKKAPRWISCLLWGLVAVRLLCPISLESVLSILPSAKVVPENIEMVQDPHIDSGVRIIDNAVNPVIEKSFSPDAASSVNPMQVVVFMGSIIWLTGMVVMLLYALISYILLRRKVRASVAMNDRVKECDEVDSPFILGIFRPEIYVPSGIDENTLELVIAHEEAHLKRHDHWWKPFGFVLLAVYWFNPLCWVAYILLCRDIEAACDEKVIKDKDREYMAAYSQALLDCSVNRRVIAACPLAFGETGVKERVRGVLNYKKPAFWMIIVAVIACIVVAVCFMTNPKKDEPDLSFLNYKNSINLLIMDGSMKKVLYYSEEYSGNESVQELTANAEDIARFLSDADWKQTDNVSERPSSNGSIELIISDEYTITLYKDQSIACVYFSGHERFYDIQPGDYENLLKVLLSHTEDNVSDNSGRNEIVRPEVLIGLNMTASDITPTGCKLVFTQDGGNATGQLETGEWFEIQVKNANGEWIDNSSKDIERGWEDIAHDINKDGITELPLEWESIYGYLSDGHYRIVKKVMDYRSPGDYDEYDVYAEFDIGNGIASAESVTDWMDITLPSGYSISSFRDDIGWQGGALILPRSYDIVAEFDSAPSEWIYSGLISRMPADNTGVTYKNGIPDLSGIPMNNHTYAEYIKVIGLERSNMQWPAIMLKESHDLYTASDMSRLSASGIDTEAMDLTSDYWSFWFVKEGEDTYYLLTLSAKEFTQEEAEEIARTVSIK